MCCWNLFAQRWSCVYDCVVADSAVMDAHQSSFQWQFLPAQLWTTTNLALYKLALCVRSFRWLLLCNQVIPQSRLRNTFSSAKPWSTRFVLYISLLKIVTSSFKLLLISDEQPDQSHALSYHRDRYCVTLIFSMILLKWLTNCIHLYFQVRQMKTLMQQSHGAAGIFSR